MGACASRPRRRHPPQWLPAEVESQTKGVDEPRPGKDAACGVPSPHHPSSADTRPPAPPPLCFLSLDAKGAASPATAVSPAHLASLASIPERDVRILLPPSPPLTTPTGAPLAGPALVAKRGDAWAVALEGVRAIALPDRVLLLACPARLGGLDDGGGRPPEPGDEAVAELGERVAAAGRGAGRGVGRPATASSPLQATALDWACEAVLAGLEARSSVLAADAAAACDSLVDAAAGRTRAGGWLCCGCGAPPATPGAGRGAATSAAALRLRQVKGEVADLEAAARRVEAALTTAVGRARRRGGRHDEAAQILAAAALRAGWAAGVGARHASSARDAESAARLALKRRALACGGV